jgi:glycerophosphoryl diester phosphodiesterase
MVRTIHLQGHRGARGLRPENTLPSFEAAFDAGANSVETDLHLTRDGVVVLTHDPFLTDRLCRELTPAAVPLARRPAVRSLTLGQVREYAADRNPDPARFPDQDDDATPAARLFAEERGTHPFAVPTLTDLFAFAAAYAGPLGERAGKTPGQRAHAGAVCFDLELKRVPGRPEYIGDGYLGTGPALFESRVVEEVRAAGVVGRTVVRSFDHRCVAHLLRLEPGLTGAVLVEGTAPVRPGDLSREAGARLYCPQYAFLDAELVREAHAAGVRVLAWTANEEDVWRRLLDMGADGITTDFPDRLSACLGAWGIEW